MPVLLILTLVGVVIFFSHTIESITGFGGVVLSFPFALAVIGNIEQVKIILSILAWILAVYFAITKFKNILWPQFFTIILISGLGMPIGMIIFKTLDTQILKKVLGGFIILSSALQLIKIFGSNNKIVSLPDFLNYGFLFLGGIVHGAFASGGPLVVIYTTKKIPEKGQFRATLCLLWTTLNSILIVQYLIENKLTAKIGFDLLFLIPFTVAGIFFGEIIHKKVDECLFKKIVTSLLLAVGVIMLVV